MVAADVSGRAMNIKIVVGPASHRISHWLHRQPSAATLNAEMMGPKEGPQVAEKEKL